MNPRALLVRAAAMDSEERRARLVSAVRARAGRVRFALSRPEWKRDRLLAVLNPASGPLVASALSAARRGEWHAAHQALSEHLQARTSYWPLKAAQRVRLSADVAQACPEAADRARETAGRILNGRLDLLGYGDVVAGDPPAWHRDPIHGRSAPRDYWARVPYLDPAIGDHKVI
jgi:hypothetical protein